MKLALLLVCVAALGGCVSGPLGPTSLPKDAYVGLWSNKPAEVVSACLSQAGLPPSYEVQPLPEKETGVYRTIVVVRTQLWATDAQALAYSRCL